MLAHSCILLRSLWMAALTSSTWIGLLHLMSSVNLMKVHSVLLSRSRLLMKIWDSTEPDITCNQHSLRFWTTDRWWAWWCSQFFTHLLSSLVQSIPGQFGYSHAVGDHVRSLLLHAHGTSYVIVEGSQVYQAKFSLVKSATAVPSHLFVLCLEMTSGRTCSSSSKENSYVLQCAPSQFQ